MRKIVSLMLVSTMSLSLLTGCGGKEEPVIAPEVTEPTQQEVTLPEINAGEIRNDALSSDIDKGTAALGDDKINITEIVGSSVLEDKKGYIYNGGTWYYDQLNEKEKEIYSVIKEALENAAGKKSDYFEFLGASGEETTRAYRAVIDDNPQILIQNIGENACAELPDGSGASVNLIYDSYWSKINVEMGQAEMEAEIKKIMKKMDVIEGDYYKILWLYNYLINSIEYNMDVPWHPTMYGALVKKQCACEGIAEAFEYILNLYGIKTIGVTGYSGFVINGVNDIGLHKWSMVKLDGEWYAFDVTWDIDKDLSKFLPYTYFAVDETDISYAHMPFFPEMVPTATGKKYNYYRYNDLVVNNYSMEELIRVGKKSYSLTPGYFTFKFKNQDDFVRALQTQELNQWIPKVIQANKLTKWQYLTAYNPDLQIIEFAIFDTVQYAEDYE